MSSGGGVRRRARVVVVGAGFAGASLLRNLPSVLRRPGETLLVDRGHDYSFIPLIHEVAVGRIHPGSVRSAIAPLCEGRCDFIKAEVAGVDLDERTLETSSGKIGYEYLVLAAGSDAARAPNGLAPHFQLFWTLQDALRLRTSLGGAWQRATTNRSPDGGAHPGDLTVAIAGGGATGVELAAEVAVLFRYLEKRTVRGPRFEPRVVLLEAENRLIGWLDEYFHDVAMEQLADLGVEVRLNAPVQEASGEGLRAGDEWIQAGVRVWTAGIDISALVGALPGEHDARGRVGVDPYLTLPGREEVYVLGDAGVYEDPRLGPLPPTASVAVQQGPWAARDLGRRLRGSSERPPFRYFDRGYVVSLGPESAVAEVVGVRLKGAPAQALYRSVLLYYLKSRRGRILAGADWAMERTLGRVGFGGSEHAE